MAKPKGRLKDYKTKTVGHIRALDMDKALVELRAMDAALADKARKPHFNRKLLTAEQERLLLTARRAGVEWPDIREAFGRRYGWRPSTNYLRDRFRELETKGA